METVICMSLRGKMIPSDEQLPLPAVRWRDAAPRGALWNSNRPQQSLQFYNSCITRPVQKPSNTFYLTGLRKKCFSNTQNNLRTYIDQLKIGSMSSEHGKNTSPEQKHCLRKRKKKKEKKTPEEMEDIFQSFSEDTWFTSLWCNIMKTELFPYYWNNVKSIKQHLTGASLLSSLARRASKRRPR